MRVISKSRLKEFWETPAGREAEGPLLAWHQRVSSKAVVWRNWNDVKRDYANASKVGNCTVFNIAGNKHRLITRILYVSQKVFVLKVMTHGEYDKDVWKDECGCFNSPPKSGG
jgi:mRNA interferase HigB